MSAHLSSAAGRWIVLAVALVGLMAMHGLSDHGVGGPSSVSAYAAPAAVAHHGDHGEGADAPAGGRSDHQHALVVVCLAVLVALLTFVLAWARPGPWRAMRTCRLRDLAIATAVRARARGPSCPDLRSLSIARC